jgi:putative addiction module killer protein
MNYNPHSRAVIDLKQTEIFREWRLSLKDDRARALIASRLDRLAFGNAGDVKPVGQGVSELRIDYGPGYRVYFRRSGKTIVLLLCGGDKRTQHRDIEMAKRLAAEWSEESGPKSNKI